MKIVLALPSNRAANICAFGEIMTGLRLVELSCPTQNRRRVITFESRQSPTLVPESEPGSFNVTLPLSDYTMGLNLAPKVHLDNRHGTT